MQGTTADPGLVAYWFFPQRCSDSIRWLIVCSCSHGLVHLLQSSLNLTKQIRDIIEQGPHEDLFVNFDKLFREKIEATSLIAREAARTLGLVLERCKAVASRL